MRIKIRVQPLQWFEKNCYKDKENDWWKNEEDAQIFFEHQPDYTADYTEGPPEYEKFFFLGHADRQNSFGKVVDADISEKKTGNGPFKNTSHQKSTRSITYE